MVPPIDPSAVPADEPAAPSPGPSPAPEPLSQPKPQHEPSASAAPSLTPSSYPEWYPRWVRDLADRYSSGTASVFVIHGDVHDLFRGPILPSDPADTYLGLTDFLGTRVFGAWDLVFVYDLARGLRILPGNDPKRRLKMLQEVTGLIGDPKTLPRDPTKVLPLLDAMIQKFLVEDPDKRPRICILFEYAQHLVPAGDLSVLSDQQEANLVRFLSWAQNPYIKQSAILFLLISARPSEINDRVLQNPHVSAIQVPLPDRDARLAFAEWAGALPEREGGIDLARISEFTPPQLAELTNGLSLHSIQVLLRQAKTTGRRVDSSQFSELKKELIEQQCQGLLEFVEPKYDLDMLVGQEEIKARLRQDCALIRRGAFQSVPMGYLVCGPVGTGKSFLAECFAGTIGIPCVTLKNFRSKYVGETEGNLEQVLDVLKSLGPVVVIIDEADAALGTRQASGDSGTSSRVFSMIARQMGDTRYRGRILWMLMTSRPDALPIDLKRQGRAEVHLPLFYPKTEAEVRAMLKAMAKKNKVVVDEGAIDKVKVDPEKRQLSGSDLESVLIGAQRNALTSDRDSVTYEDLAETLENFLPSAQGLEKEAQELAAVLECTDVKFLPEVWRKKVAEPDGRAHLQERLVQLRQLMHEG